MAMEKMKDCTTKLVAHGEHITVAEFFIDQLSFQEAVSFESFGSPPLQQRHAVNIVTADL